MNSQPSLNELRKHVESIGSPAYMAELVFEASKSRRVDSAVAERLLSCSGRIIEVIDAIHRGHGRHPPDAVVAEVQTIALELAASLCKLAVASSAQPESLLHSKTVLRAAIRIQLAAWFFANSDEESIETMVKGNDTPEPF